MGRWGSAPGVVKFVSATASANFPKFNFLDPADADRAIIASEAQSLGVLQYVKTNLQFGLRSLRKLVLILLRSRCVPCSLVGPVGFLTLSVRKRDALRASTNFVLVFYVSHRHATLGAAHRLVSN